MSSKSDLSTELRAFLAPTDSEEPGAGPVSKHGVWGPGIRLMRNLRFAAKALLICALFLVPILWLSRAYYGNMSMQIGFSAKERVGVEYNRAIFPLLKTAQEWRNAEAAGSAGAAQQIQSRLQSEHEKLLGTDAQLGGELDTKKAMAGVLAAHGGVAQPGGTVAYTDALVTLLGQATDASNLTLDPDIDSYYLMDAAYFRIPDLTESTSRLGNLGRAAFQSGTVDAASLRGLVQSLTLAQFQLKNMQDGLGKAFAYNDALRAPLDAKPTFDATQEFFDFARDHLVEKQDFSPTALARFNQLADQAQSLQHGLLVRLVDSLDALLVTRIDGMAGSRITTTVVLAVGLVLALYLFYCFFLVTRGGLLLISKHLDKMAEGDLRQRPRKPWGSDEPADVIHDLRKAYDALHILIRKVRHSARALHEASGEIAAASADLGARTESSAAALEQQSSSMEEINAMASATAERASMAATFAVDNAHVAERGGAVFSEVVSTMRDIHTSSAKINDIITVIDGIAFQTNILALNAAVEAARAGETGRGFAVVASEVRMLAQRSAGAAKEIKSLISASVERVESGTRVIEAAGQTMTEVVTNARQINAFLSDIAVAAKDQANAVSEVGRSILELDQNTQQNAALVEQTSAAAGALNGQADVLQSEIANFQVK
jgi:methyl-accepting chemotaxis protein